MPWTKKNVDEHKKGLSDKQKAHWVAVANAQLEAGKSEAEAIESANAAVDRMADENNTGDPNSNDQGIKNAGKINGTDGEKGGKKADIRAGEPNPVFELVDMLRRDASLSLAKPSSYDPKSREADAVISTGARVRRRDWIDEYDEVLDMSPGAIRLQRLNNGAALLDSHKYFSGLDSMLGGIVPGSARVEKNKLVARIKFSQHSELARRVAGDLADGIQFPMSAGYKVHKFIEDKTTNPPTRMITDWEPLEVSLVTVPAEQEGTGIRGEPRRKSANNGVTPMDKPLRRPGESDADFQKRIVDFHQKNLPVDGETVDQLNKRSDDYLAAVKRDEADAAKVVDAARAKKEADDKHAADLADAVKRAETPPVVNNSNPAEILAIGRQAKMPLEEIEKGLREGCTPEQFRQRAFQYLIDKQPTVSGTGPSDDGIEATSFEVGSDRALTGRAAAMAEALTIRALSVRRQPAVTSQDQKEWAELRGLTDKVSQSWRIFDGKEQPADPRVRQYLGASMVDIAAECIGYRGRGLLTIAKAGDVMTRAFNSTGDFPAIFENVLNKTLLARYQLAMPTYREISVERPFNDFRPHPQVRAGDFPLLQPLTETGELRAGASQDNKETASVTPYGVIFGISRQMIVNDELGAIDQILGDSGNTVLIFENKTFFDMFQSGSVRVGPTLNQDALPVFAYGAITIPPATAVGHNNYADTHAHGGDTPSITTIGAARQALRGMKSLSGYYLNVPPRIILAGPQQETVVDQMVTAIAPTLTTSVNPFSGRLRAVSDANITTADWYVLAEPSQVPCFVYGFLAGATGPRVRTEEPFGVQGVRVSLEHDFGVGAIDYRGVYRNSGLTS